jgi:hypothetical protein
MSTWRCGWICPFSGFFAAVFLAGASLAVVSALRFLGLREVFAMPLRSTASCTTREP